MTDKLPGTPVSPELQAVFNRIFAERFPDYGKQRDGAARQAFWLAEDGWAIVYTTSRIEGGPHHGRFLVQTFKPVGRGSRSGRGKAEDLVENYRREFATRKAAKARAEALYRQHSPRWDARHPKGTRE